MNDFHKMAKLILMHSENLEKAAGNMQAKRDAVLAEARKNNKQLPPHALTQLEHNIENLKHASIELRLAGKSLGKINL
jgi:hypothetical protein